MRLGSAAAANNVRTEVVGRWFGDPVRREKKPLRL